MRVIEGLLPGSIERPAFGIGAGVGAFYCRLFAIFIAPLAVSNSLAPVFPMEAGNKLIPLSCILVIKVLDTPLGDR